jgi:hypothetical protein
MRRAFVAPVKAPAKVAQTFLSALFAKAEVIRLREYVYGGQAD